MGSDKKDQPWWEELGFASKEEFWEDAKANYDPAGIWTRKRNRKKVPGPSLPRADAPARGRRSQPRTEQVNVKLTPEDHAALAQAATLYGVAPATMAQLLVNRGVRAVLEADEEP